MSCKIVAEIGINHSGSLDIAKKLIDVAVLYGCDYVKFQKRDIESCYTKEELDKYRESPWGTTNREQKYGLEFNFNDYLEIDNYCKNKNIQWFASPWDVKSVEFLSFFDIPFIKIPSALITNMELLEAVKEADKPIIIGTGMSTIEEINKCYDFLDGKVKYILACCSVYPTPTEDVNLNKIKTLKSIYKLPKIGFSNHHPGTFFTTAAAVMGCEMVEFHITLDRSSYGSDQSASIEPNGVRIICDHIRSLELAMGNGKFEPTNGEIEVMKKLRR